MKASKHVTVGELMTKSPHTVGVAETLAVAYKKMREHGLRHLPVLDGDRLAGVVTERDLYFLESMSGVALDVDLVSDAMSPHVCSAKPHDHLKDVARQMADNKYGCAVIIHHGAVVGIFTTTDALRYLAEVTP